MYVSKLPPKNPMVHTRENVRMTVMIMLSVILWNISPSADDAAVIIRNSTTT